MNLPIVRISVPDMTSKNEKRAKPTAKDRATAELLSRMWEAYRRANPGPDGKPLKQAALIEGTGLSQSAVSQYLNGYLKFGYGAVLKFAKFFDVPPSSIRDDLDALPDAPGRVDSAADPALRQLEHEIDAIQFALGALAIAFARQRPDEAGELDAMLAKAPAPFQDAGLIPGLRKALGGAAAKAPGKLRPKAKDRQAS